LETKIGDVSLEKRLPFGEPKPNARVKVFTPRRLNDN